MKITALVDRFGSNRMNADKPAELLKGCTCINVPFAGGMCEVAWFKANIVNVNDLDRHVVNLAKVICRWRSKLAERLDATPFHPDVLAEAQAYCQDVEARLSRKLIPFFDSTVDIDALLNHFEWAYHYFVASWMTRGGKMGTHGEFEQGLSVRWKSGGGDSVVRFRNATESLAEWQKVMRKCTFHTLDCFDFLAECRKRDIAENGIYCDPPWPDDGDNYTHKFTQRMHEKLCYVLQAFENAKIVVRFGDHPLIRELYREPHWTCHRLTSRTQSNSSKDEVLLTRNIG